MKKKRQNDWIFSSADFFRERSKTYDFAASFENFLIFNPYGCFT